MPSQRCCDEVTNATSSAIPGSNQPTASFDYAYDQSGNRTKITRASEVTSYAYDQLSRLQTVTDPSGGAFGFTRDALGRLQEMTRPNGVKTTYTWDQADQVKDIVHASTAGTLDQAHYAYNNAGLRTQLTDNWGAHNYTYDAAGQLTGADNPGAQPDEAYSYDLLGNRVSGGYGGQIHDAANRLTSDNKFLYAYDAEGNLTAKTERALGTVTSYSWDAEHRLRQVTLPSGQVERFRYDPVGRRIEVVAPAGTKRYAYGADQNFQAEFDGSNNLAASYTFGLGLDTPLEMRRGSTASYYQQDALGSVGSLTSSSGAVSQRYAYGAFGQALTASDASGNPFSFTGRELDSASGDYVYRARIYDSAVGGFTSEDPITSIAERRYARGNPVSLRDPTGETEMADLVGETATSAALATVATAGFAAVLPHVITSARLQQIGDMLSASNDPGVDKEDLPKVGPYGPIDLDGFEWEGDEDGSYWNPETEESIHPDLDHPPPIGPHYDYGVRGRDINGKRVPRDQTQWWRIYPDGTRAPK